MLDRVILLLCQGCEKVAGFLFVEGPAGLTYAMANLRETMLEGDALL